MQAPHVSISCLTFNHENYIAECLEGILMQKTNFTYEILIHDDASTDATPSIVREFQARYPEIIKPVFQTVNQLSAGNRLLNPTFNFPRARGKYIALCDGDDYWTDPLKLQKQVDYLEANPGCAMCFHKVKEKFEDYVRFRTFSHLEDREYSGNDIVKQWTIPTVSVVFRNYGIEMGAKDSRILFGDIVLYLRLSKMGTLRCLAKEGEMAVYRRHLGSLTKDKRSIKYIKKLVNHNEYLNENFENDIKEIINKTFFDLNLTLCFKCLPNKRSFYYLKRSKAKSDNFILDVLKFCADRFWSYSKSKINLIRAFSS